MIKVALIHPEIPFNTGNIGRTCVAVKAQLHLVAPLGFSLSERRVRRAGMDYWESLDLKIHHSLDDFLSCIKNGEQPLAFSAEGARTHYEAPYHPDAWLIFGSESCGLPAVLRERWRDNLFRVPMVPGARSLNLSTAAAVVLYAASRDLFNTPNSRSAS